MPNNTVTAAQEAKLQLEKDILDRVIAFEKAYGLQVKSLYVGKSMKLVAGDEITTDRVEVTVEL